MADLAYLLGTLAFFGAMLAYVRGCAALGGGDAAGRADAGARHASAEPRP